MCIHSVLEHTLVTLFYLPPFNYICMIFKFIKYLCIQTPCHPIASAIVVCLYETKIGHDSTENTLPLTSESDRSHDSTKDEQVQEV